MRGVALTAVVLVLLASCREECPDNPALELRDGSVCFGKVRSYEIPSAAGKFLAEDLEGDGDVDFVFGGALEDEGSGAAAIHVLRNTTGREFATTSIDLAGAADEIVLGDLDGDGDLDIAARATSGVVWLLENDGAAAFEVVNEIGANARAVITSDLDGDGDDTLITISEDHMLALTGGALEPSSVSAVIGPVDSEDRCLYVGDASGDGVADVFTEQWLYPGSGGGLGDPEALALPDEGGCGVVFDLDVDGIDDLLFCDGVWLGPLREEGPRTSIPDFPRYDPLAPGCLAAAVARGPMITPTFVAFSDNIERGVSDYRPGAVCRSIAAVLPQLGSDDPIGLAELGEFVAGGRSQTWSDRMDIVDLDADGAVDLIEPTPDGLDVRYGRDCD